MGNVRNDKLRNVTCHSLRSSVVFLSPFSSSLSSSFISSYFALTARRNCCPFLCHILVACAGFLPGLFRFIFRGTSNDVLVQWFCLTRLVSPPPPLPDTYSLALSLPSSDSLSLSPFRRCRLCSRDLLREDSFQLISASER